MLLYSRIRAPQQERKMQTDNKKDGGLRKPGVWSNSRDGERGGAGAGLQGVEAASIMVLKKVFILLWRKTRTKYLPTKFTLCFKNAVVAYVWDAQRATVCTQTKVRLKVSGFEFRFTLEAVVMWSCPSSSPVPRLKLKRSKDQTEPMKGVVGVVLKRKGSAAQTLRLYMICLCYQGFNQQESWDRSFVLFLFLVMFVGLYAPLLLFAMHVVQVFLLYIILHYFKYRYQL